MGWRWRTFPRPLVVPRWDAREEARQVVRGIGDGGIAGTSRESRQTSADISCTNPSHNLSRSPFVTLTLRLGIAVPPLRECSERKRVRAIEHERRTHQRLLPELPVANLLPYVGNQRHCVAALRGRWGVARRSAVDARREVRVHLLLVQLLLCAHLFPFPSSSFSSPLLVVLSRMSLLSPLSSLLSFLSPGPSNRTECSKGSASCSMSST